MSFNASYYDKIYPDREKEIDFLLKHLKGKTVLDIGGGTGVISEVLNKEGFICCNVEPQKEMAKISDKDLLRKNGFRVIEKLKGKFITTIIAEI